MPQDQDDIKGADTMKQAPTPGPLSGDDVKLLVKGDVISHPKWGVSTYLPDTDERPVGLVGPWSFIGRPDESGWMPWSGGENPVPGRHVNLRHRGLFDQDEGAYLSDDQHWTHGAGEQAEDIIAFRLAPEASGSELARAIADGFFNGNQGYNDCNDMMRLSFDMAAEAVLKLRPQPSWSEEVQAADTTHSRRLFFGDPGSPQPTRDIASQNEASGVLGWFSGLARKEGHHVQADWLDSYIASIRPAPVASGGQHSSGEGDMVRWGLVWQGETTWFDTKEEALSAKGSSQGVELVSSAPEWRSGEGAPVYPKGTVVSYRGRHFRALRDVKASAKTNAPNYSGLWEEVK